MTQYKSGPTVDEPGGLARTIGFGTIVDGTLARKNRCLSIARENIEQAASIITNGPHPSTSVLQLELALMHMGNAVALIYDRDIEGKSDEFGLHNAAARAIVAYADAEMPSMSDVARFAARYVRGRNDYSYRHERLKTEELTRLYKAAVKIYESLEPDVRTKAHLPLGVVASGQPRRA